MKLEDANEVIKCAIEKFELIDKAIESGNIDLAKQIARLAPDLIDSMIQSYFKNRKPRHIRDIVQDLIDSGKIKIEKNE